MNGLVVRCGVVVVLTGVAHGDEPAGYRSPYSVAFTVPERELLGDILDGSRGAARDLSTVPLDDWYSPSTRKRWGAWGPPAKSLPAPDGLDKRSADWQRERVIAVALRYRGYSYQHHHLPDWDPPADWPWKDVDHGRNAKGVDCSNFTAFVYNLALGLKPNSDVKKQAEETELPGQRSVQRIEKPQAYADFAKALQTGDLLFVKNDKGEVSHVVLWVGPIGRSPDGVPLVLDSTSTGHKDSNGAVIPDGVNLRPFRESSWYHRSASHVLRLIP